MLFLFFDLGYKTLAITLAEKFARRSHKLQVLPPESPPSVEGHEFETMERPAYVDAHIENTAATKTREYFSFYDNPLVQLPPAADPPCQFTTKGQAGSSN